MTFQVARGSTKQEIRNCTELCRRIPEGGEFSARLTESLERYASKSGTGADAIISSVRSMLQKAVGQDVEVSSNRLISKNTVSNITEIVVRLEGCQMDMTAKLLEKLNFCANSKSMATDYVDGKLKVEAAERERLRLLQLSRFVLQNYPAFLEVYTNHPKVQENIALEAMTILGNQNGTRDKVSDEAIAKTQLLKFLCKPEVAELLNRIDRTMTGSEVVIKGMCSLIGSTGSESLARTAVDICKLGEGEFSSLLRIMEAVQRTRTENDDSHRSPTWLRE